MIGEPVRGKVYHFLVACEESVRALCLFLQSRVLMAPGSWRRQCVPTAKNGGQECPPFLRSFFLGCYSSLRFTSPLATTEYPSPNWTLGKQTRCLLRSCHKCHSGNQPLGHAHVQCNLFPPSWAPASPSEWLEPEPSLREPVAPCLSFEWFVNTKLLFS